MTDMTHYPGDTCDPPHELTSAIEKELLYKEDE